MSTDVATTRTTTSDWVAGARPRTLPVSVVPVAVGAAVAYSVGDVVWWRTLLALVVSLSIQIGTNYANDYSDGVRGTDQRRVGPVRLVAGGLASPHAVLRAAAASFAVAAAAGLVLAVATSPYLVLLGAACLAAGWLYTGGPRPYGYAGFGEAFVFVFFGLVATVGTVYVSIDRVPALSFVAAVPVGLLAVAILVVNNLRDVHNDAVSGKRTLAVLIGEPRTRLFYLACFVGTFAGVIGVATYHIGALIALAPVPFAVPPLRAVLEGAKGRDLVDVLVVTGLLDLVTGLLLAAGVAWR